MGAKPDEIALYALLREERQKPYQTGPMVDTLAYDRLGMAYKRSYYLLSKWMRKGWWMCGVSMRTGWFEPRAPDSLVQPVPNHKTANSG